MLLKFPLYFNDTQFRVLFLGTMVKGRTQSAGFSPSIMTWTPGPLFARAERLQTVLVMPEEMFAGIGLHGPLAYVAEQE